MCSRRCGPTARHAGVADPFGVREGLRGARNSGLLTSVLRCDLRKGFPGPDPVGKREGKQGRDMEWALSASWERVHRVQLKQKGFLPMIWSFPSGNLGEAKGTQSRELGKCWITFPALPSHSHLIILTRLRGETTAEGEDLEPGH